MSFRQWIYHATEEPKIIDSDDFEAHKSEGWADSPAQFLTLEACGISKEKIADGDTEEAQKAQQALDAVEGVKESLNGALNLDKMDKDELEDYAKEHLGVDLDKRKSIPNLIKEIEALINGDSE